MYRQLYTKMQLIDAVNELVETLETTFSNINTFEKSKDNVLEHIWNVYSALNSFECKLCGIEPELVHYNLYAQYNYQVYRIIDNYINNQIDNHIEQ